MIFNSCIHFPPYGLTARDERGLEIPLLGVPLFSLLESAQVSSVLPVSLTEEIQS